MRRVFCLLAALLGCAGPKPSAPVMPEPRYFLGAPYRAGGIWIYPAESYSAEQSGVAAIDTDGHSALTADGELYDPTALACAHPTSQLPAIARLENVETGRIVTVRLNDRGPGDPARLVSCTKRVATLLRMTGPARVRLTVLPDESHAAVEAVGGGPKLAIAAAPRGEVTATDLAPVGMAGNAGPSRTIGAAATPIAPRSFPLKLPERVTQSYASPGPLYVDLGTFTTPGPARRQASRAAVLAPETERTRDGRTTYYYVFAGPYDTIAEADAALRRVIAAGVTDARLTLD